MRCDAMRCDTPYLSRGMLCYDSHKVYLLSIEISIYLSIYLSSIDLIDNATTTTITPFPPFDETNTNTTNKNDIIAYATMQWWSLHQYIHVRHLDLNPRPPASYASIPHITHHPTTPLPINPRYTTDSSWRDLDRIPEKHPNLSGSESNVRDSSIRARDGSDWVYPRWMDGWIHHVLLHLHLHMIFLLQPGLTWLVSFAGSCSLDLRIENFNTSFLFLLHPRHMDWSVERMLYFLWTFGFLFCLFCCLLAGLLSFFGYFLFSYFLLSLYPYIWYHDQISTNQY